MTEDIITQLSRIGDLKVISRTSVMRYKRTNKSMREIAEELKVAAILEGSVRRVGNRVRIVGQLIDAETDEHLWADTYDRELHDVFEIQSNVAQQIAEALKATLSPLEKKRIESRPTENLTAYDYYLKGRELYNRSGGKESNEQAIALFQKALELDSDFALAYAGLGDAYTVRIIYGFPGMWLGKAIEASKKAIALDPNLAEGYEALAYATIFQGSYSRALEPARKAVELNPNYARAAGVLGRCYLFTGRPDEALSWMKKFAELDPISVNACKWVGLVYASLGDLVQAERWFRRAQELDPENVLETLVPLASLYLQTGKDDLAAVQLQKLLAIAPDDIQVLEVATDFELLKGNLPMSRNYCERALNILKEDYYSFFTTRLAYILLKEGRQQEADKMLEQSLKYDSVDPKEDRSVLFDLAAVNTIRGKRSEAFKWLEKAFDQGGNPSSLDRNPLFENLREDPEFKQLLTRVKAKRQQMLKRAETK